MSRKNRSSAPASSRHVRGGDLVRLAVTWGISTCALMVADGLQPKLSAETPWSFVAVAAVCGLFGLVVRPLLVAAATRIGWVAILPLALVGEGVVVYLSMQVVPGITTTFAAAVVTSWIVAAVGTVVAYVGTAGTDEALTMALARRARTRESVPDPEVDGVVFVQLDGVPFPVMQWAVQSGGVPTIRRWLSSGAYQLREWTPQLPCTTPASQLGILHGTVLGVPAFRWFDRELGRVLVTNRPADAKIVEDRASDGHGLLCENGVSISNLFSGDAERSMLTMSRMGASRGSPTTRRAMAWFLATPSGFARSLTRTVAEVVKERWQARRQDRRRLEPRVARDWTFALLRAVSNGLLRDLNTALVAEEMFRGTKVVYVDYVDYDEIAHHAGMFRPESLAALDGLDHVLGQLEQLAAHAARRYHIVVLSDHGQSQGRPFADRYGVDLGTLCAGLMAEQVGSYDSPVEGWGRTQALLEDVGHEGVSGRVAAPAGRRLRRKLEERPQSPHDDDIVVLGSGNLGLLYVRGRDRLTLDELDERWPGLVPGLRSHPGVGFVAGVDGDGVPWVLGAQGRRNLRTGTVEGEDPLAPFGEHARGVLCRAVSMPEAPDLYVNSGVDEDTLDVAAFEGLVGAHGGLGGWQDRAVLLAPRDLVAETPRSVLGADQMHVVLTGMLRRAGQRAGPRQRQPSAPPSETGGSPGPARTIRDSGEVRANASSKRASGRSIQSPSRPTRGA